MENLIPYRMLLGARFYLATKERIVHPYHALGSMHREHFLSIGNPKVIIVDICMVGI